MGAEIERVFAVKQRKTGIPTLETGENLISARFHPAQNLIPHKESRRYLPIGANMHIPTAISIINPGKPY